MGTCNDCRLATVSDVTNAIAGAGGAEIGFDTLSNVLVVDPGFDENTDGWAVTAYSSLGAAMAAAANNATIIVNGETSEDSIATVQDSVNIMGLVGSKVVFNVAGNNGFSADATHNVVISNLAMEQTEDGSAVVGTGVGSGGTFALSESQILHTGSAASFPAMFMQGGDIFVNNSKISSSTGIAILLSSYTSLLNNCDIASPTIALQGISPVLDANIHGCAITGGFVNVTINALNHSNLVDGVTHREVVLVASLPAASAANQGVTAMTSDGGTAGAPAMMVNLDGANWTVAYE